MEEREKRTIILVVLDTMRKDYADRYIWPVLKKYGFKKYDRAIAPAPWTTPSHVSMLTGMYPLEHGVHRTKDKKLVSEIKIPLWLRSKLAHKKLSGTSLLVSSNILVSNYYGYCFDHYYDATTLQAIPKKAHFITEKDILKIKYLRRQGNMFQMVLSLFKEGDLGLIARIALTKIARFVLSSSFKFTHPNWPKDMGGKKILRLLETIKEPHIYQLILLNFMEMHEPYTIFDNVSDLSKRYWKSFYRKEARYLTTLIKNLLSIISAHLEDPLIIITADHGQLLGEYNLFGHEQYLYDELVRVPLYTNFEIDNPNDWFSLKNVYHLILGEPIPREPATLSEYFGVFPHDPDLTPKHRIAVYYKEYKGIFNVDDWKWECWKTYNGEEEVPEEIKKEMMKIVLRHLKKGLMMKKARELGKKLKTRNRTT